MVSEASGDRSFSASHPLKSKDCKVVSKASGDRLLSARHLLKSKDCKVVSEASDDRSFSALHQLKSNSCKAGSCSNAVKSTKLKQYPSRTMLTRTNLATDTGTALIFRRDKSSFSALLARAPLIRRPASSQSLLIPFSLRN